MRTGLWSALAAILLAAPGTAQELVTDPSPPIVSDLLIHSGSFQAGRSHVAPGHCPEVGTRSQTKYVFFDPPFLETPQVVVALNSFDMDAGRNPRIVARADNVSRIAMRLIVETWCDTNLTSAGGTYMVMGRQGALADIMPLGPAPAAQGAPSPRLRPREEPDNLDDW